jgi:universal stress protein A
MRLDSAAQQVSAGSPKREIARIARESEVDLIVIGTSGMGGIKRLLGSTTNGVLHDAPCDILSVQAVSEDA